MNKMQKRTARFVTGNYTYETDLGISEYRRKDNRLILLCIGLTGAANIPTNDFFITAGVHGNIFRDWYLQVECLTPIIRDWNSLAYSLISTAECADGSFSMLYLL